ncbi:hypothetical protein CL652_00465 [bacterium]|nr:hypothetical protein [bacterium]|tara:strand:+ start:9410 stop:10318 length:909 start_codon:yes stop_codon:yes gene_type:complete
MFKKSLFLILIVTAFIVLWTVFQYSQVTSSENSATQLFQMDFVSAISEQVTGSLSLIDSTSKAQVRLEELGELSPVTGMVEIQKRDIESLKMQELEYQYIEIRAKETNAQPINISNWSIQSMISDTWIGIPQGVERYVAGEVNELQDIYLRPGDRALIATKQSPVGVSFRVNRCSGFLGTTQTFEPSLRTACINPRDILPPTIDNLKEYGAECVRFAENFDRCSYVTDNTRGYSNLSQACLDRIQPRLTYNYCIEAQGNDEDFFNPGEWRIFLNQDGVAWRDSYEVVRLLDENNRTVDVVTY